MIENKDKLNTQNHEIQLLCHYSYFGVFFFSKNYAFRQNIQVSFRRKEKILMKYLKLILNSPLPKCLRVNHEIKYLRLAER